MILGIKGRTLPKLHRTLRQGNLLEFSISIGSVFIKKTALCLSRAAVMILHQIRNNLMNNNDFIK